MNAKLGTLFLALGLLAAGCGAPIAAVAPAGEGVDRPGSDYKDFDLDQPDYNLCKNACLAEAECQAWTYVKPGAQGDKARCWLKNAVPGAEKAACCTSGVRTATGSTVEN